jgi:hypothetical protein
MSTLATLAIALVVALALYFVSSGVAFALMYRIGERFPNRAVGRVYEPLEWLSRRSGAFRYLYNGLHAQCYRLFVGELVDGWVPPPPGIAKHLRAKARDDQQR